MKLHFTIVQDAFSENCVRHSLRPQIGQPDYLSQPI
jgi:hypothetical protein